MLPSDRLLCVFVEHLNQGDQFTEWPLHVTVVPWFRVDMASDKLAAEFCDNICDFKSFQVVMGDETKFGRGKTVNLVALPTLFTEIEEQVSMVLERHDAWRADKT